MERHETFWLPDCILFSNTKSSTKYWFITLTWFNDLYLFYWSHNFQFCLHFRTSNKYFNKKYAGPAKRRWIHHFEQVWMDIFCLEVHSVTPKQVLTLHSSCSSHSIFLATAGNVQTHFRPKSGNISIHHLCNFNPQKHIKTSHCKTKQKLTVEQGVQNVF